MQYQKGTDSKFVVVTIRGKSIKYRVEVEFLDEDVSGINVYREVDKPIEEVQDEPTANEKEPEVDKEAVAEKD